MSKQLNFIIAFGVLLCGGCSTDATRKPLPPSEQVALTVPQTLRIPDSNGLKAKLLERGKSRVTRVRAMNLLAVVHSYDESLGAAELEVTYKGLDKPILEVWQFDGKEWYDFLFRMTLAPGVAVPNIEGLTARVKQQVAAAQSLPYLTYGSVRAVGILASVRSYDALTNIANLQVTGMGPSIKAWYFDGKEWDDVIVRLILSPGVAVPRLDTLRARLKECAETTYTSDGLQVTGILAIVRSYDAIAHTLDLEVRYPGSPAKS